ncbi:hypothetical protein IIE18_11215 [Pseudomonas sp. V1]|uniref:hypothetical protein n=1 Tax=Pseudomonas arcuscaelestis TaxID=2710591 RepID=UPI00194001B1|nr:hypothetical protein [Pseudomonas arcuscaelestis]MBM3105710.1 hypothetical protein [Pseudomonas arcuscaelestis]
MNGVSRRVCVQLNSFKDSGLTLESHFPGGIEGTIARHTAPKLMFPESMPLELVRDHIEHWNRMLQGLLPGMGYYAFSPMDEMANPGNHVLVLFADDSFFNALRGGVQKVDELTLQWGIGAGARLLR